MELSWSTFALEIINFLVLVWLLKRFLYKPVMNVIAQRQARVEGQLNEAKSLKQQAEQLKQQYETRLETWEKEKQQARVQFQQQLDMEKANQEKVFKQKLAQQHEKAAVLQRRHEEQLQKKVEADAMQQAAEFASHLLAQASGQALETRLLEMLMRDLELLPAADIDKLQQQWGTPSHSVSVSSVYQISHEHQQNLETLLHRIFGADINIDYTQDDSLLAGLAIHCGAWNLAFNLRDELKSFAEFAHANNQS